MSLKIALLGANSTGKSQLANGLVAHLTSNQLRAVETPEFLREWCNKHGRSPLKGDQSEIANTQAERANYAAESGIAEYVIVDTTPMMTAIYSHYFFNDESLYEFAVLHQQSYDLTLVTALDLPWVAGSTPRNGEHAREPFDALLRSALETGHIPYQVIYGHGLARLQNCIDAINCIAKTPIPNSQSNPTRTAKRMQNWACEKCSDPDCEHTLFRQLVLEQPG